MKEPSQAPTIWINHDAAHRAAVPPASGPRTALCRRWVVVGWSMLMVTVGITCNSAAADPGRDAEHASVPTGVARSGPSPGSTVTMAELRQRPLRFPTPAPASACPADSQVPVSPNLHKPAEFAFGSGPAYLNGNNSWYAGAHGQGANLLFNTRSSGPMLVRTRRLDGDGRLSLKTADIPAQAREPWRLTAIETADGLEIEVPPIAEHWPVWTGKLMTDRPGCFGLQVDGDRFRGMIVITVLPGPVPPA